MLQITWMILVMLCFHLSFEVYHLTCIVKPKTTSYSLFPSLLRWIAKKKEPSLCLQQDCLGDIFFFGLVTQRVFSTL